MGKGQGALLIRRTGQVWRVPNVQTYRDEEMLKLMLRESPQLLTMCPKGSVFVDELAVPATIWSTCMQGSRGPKAIEKALRTILLPGSLKQLLVFLPNLRARISIAVLATMPNCPFRP